MHGPTAIPVIFSMLNFPLMGAMSLLDLIPINLGQKTYEPSFGDYASQGFGLINYFAQLKPSQTFGIPASGRNHNYFKETNLLGIPDVKGVPDLPGLPNIPLLSGVPAVPGLTGSIPGAGGCLPKGTPLVNMASPSILQDLLRGIPGAQDLLKSFVKPIKVDPKRLMGKWYWVVSTPSVLSRYCATSEYSGLTNPNGSSSSFSILDSYHDGAPHGNTKFEFGYGLVVNDQVSVYTQSDPCPFQIVGTGPIAEDGQYEYLILSNWAKYPVIGLTRDLTNFFQTQKFSIENDLRTNGYTNFFTDALGSVSIMDWSYCRPANSHNPGNLAVDLVNEILFGKSK